jgi:hypothetical protein
MLLWGDDRGIPLDQLEKMNPVRLKSGEYVDFLGWLDGGQKFAALPMAMLSGPVVRRTRDIDRRFHGRAVKIRARNRPGGPPMG